MGAFYTPQRLASKLVKWAIRQPSDRVLDPAFGGLVFLREAEDHLKRLGATSPCDQIFGIDLDGDAVSAASSFSDAGASLTHKNFLSVEPRDGSMPRVEAVIGNPPYVRYQNFDGSLGRAVADRHGVKLNRMASLWAPMLVHSTDFVADGGRLAKVLPAELIHAKYASELMNFVGSRFARVLVVMFRNHVFPGAQEEVVLLLADGRGSGPADEIEVVEFADVDEFSVPDRSGRALQLDDEHKLLAGLVEIETLRIYDELRASESTRTLGELASVDIGAVTGANDWFIRGADDVEGIPDALLRPAVSKANQVRGARLSATEVTRRMLVIDSAADFELPGAIAEQIATAEAVGIHQRYKCRIRSPWYSLPRSQVSDPPHLLLTYMSSDCPRLAVNSAGALNTNTVHGVRLRNGSDPKGLAAAFYSSLTMLSAELIGRSYGGGVLKLEPSEAERLVIPRPSGLHKRLLRQVDALLRERRVGELRRLVDQEVLVGDLGIAPDDVRRLQDAADLLRMRRMSRARRCS